MKCQMILVISSPSSSTIGPTTLIFATSPSSTVSTSNYLGSGRIATPRPGRISLRSLPGPVVVEEAEEGLPPRVGGVGHREVAGALEHLGAHDPAGIAVAGQQVADLADHRLRRERVGSRPVGH